MSLSPEPRDVEMTDAGIEGEQQTNGIPVSENHASASSAVEPEAKVVEEEQTISGKTIVPAHEQSYQAAPTPFKNGSLKPASDTKKRQSLSSTERIKLDKEVARIKEFLSYVSTSAIQQVLRENWREFLFDGYDENHVSFIVRAGLKNSTPAVLGRVMRDDRVFGEQFQNIASQKPSIIRKVLEDVTITQLTEHLPKVMIDKIVAESIKNAPAKELINWLSAGKRLGFRPDDMLEVSDESVVPNVPVRTYPNQPPIKYQTPAVYNPSPPSLQQQPYQQVPQRPSPYQTQILSPSTIRPPPSLAGTYPPAPAHSSILPPKSYAQDSLLREQERNKAAQDAVAATEAENRKAGVALKLKLAKIQGAPGDLTCNLCDKQLPTQSGYLFHIAQKVCQDSKYTEGKYICTNCDKHFLGKQGLNYHMLRHVCKKPSTGVDASMSTPTTSSQPPRPPTHSAAPSARPPTAVTAVQRPPMHTPKGKIDETEHRMSTADLPPARRAAMDAEIADEDRRFHEKLVALNADLSVPEGERLRKETGYRNANATRKSQIRRSYNVSLRLRDNQKITKVAGSTPTSIGGRLEEFRAPASSATKPNPRAPQANGVSPVNTPGTNTPDSGSIKGSHVDYINGPIPPAVADPKLNALLNFRPSVANTNYQHVSKRQRTSEDTSSPGTGCNSLFGNAPPQPSGMAMIHSEDAATRYARNKKKATPVRESVVPIPAKMAPSKNIAVVLPSFGGSGAKESAYTIVDTSSEGDDDDDDDEDIPATSVGGGGNGVKSVRSGDAVDKDEDDMAAEIMDSIMPSIEAAR